MSDRRSQRIRAQLRQQPNPRAGRPTNCLPFTEQMRHVYLKADVQPAAPADSHRQLARQLEIRRKGRR
jgi:hypothetical protein